MSTLKAIGIVSAVVLTTAALGQKVQIEPGLKVNPVKLYSQDKLRQRLRFLYSNLAASSGLAVDDAKAKIGSLQQFYETASHVGGGINTVPVINPADPAGILEAQKIDTGTPVGLSGTSGTPSLSGLQTLVQQVNFQYEILNLEVLMSRAISDTVDLNSGSSRQTVLLGIPITIMAGNKFQNRVAEVSVTVKSSDGGGIPQVVALMPQARTYNVQRIVRGSRAFSLGAISTFLGLGLSTSNQSDNIYLVQDYDTVALSGGSSETESRFGWQFRPVLESQVIDPGDRFLLVALSLPSTKDQILKVSTQTKWRRYNAKTRVVGAVDETLNNCSVDLNDSSLPVKLASLRPEVKNIRVVPSQDSKQLSVSLTGNNFLDDLNLFVEDKSVPLSGSAANSIQFNLSTDDFLVKPVEYIGFDGKRYSLTRIAEEGVVADASSLKASIQETFGDDEHIEIECDKSCNPKVLELLKQEPILVVGNKLFGLHNGLVTDGSHFSVSIPYSETKDVRAVTLIAPFTSFSTGELAHFTLPLTRNGLFDVTSVTQVLAPENFVQFVLRGRGLRKVDITVPGPKGIADPKPVGRFNYLAPTTPADDVVPTSNESSNDYSVALDDAILIKFKKELLQNGMILILREMKDGVETGNYKLVDLPKTKELSELLKPEDDKDEIILKPIDQYFSGALLIQGLGAKSVVAAMLVREQLEIIREGKKVYIVIPSSVSSKPGPRNILMKVKRQNPKEGDPEFELRSITLEVKDASKVKE